MGWSLAAALALHLALAAALMLLPAPVPPPAPEEAIAVEFVPSSELLTAPARPLEPLPDTAPDAQASVPARPAPSRQTPSRPAPPPEPQMIRPSAMLSSRSLADPRSRQSRLALRTLSDEDRAEQLCGLEAMEQVAAWRRDFRPDRLVAYARGEPKHDGNVVEANGGAFRSRSLWYAIRFRCELTPDRTRVAAFAFAVGEPVPRDEWEVDGLPAVH